MFTYCTFCFSNKTSGGHITAGQIRLSYDLSLILLILWCLARWVAHKVPAINPGVWSLYLLPVFTLVFLQHLKTMQVNPPALPMSKATHYTCGWFPGPSTRWVQIWVIKGLFYITCRLSKFFFAHLYYKWYNGKLLLEKLLYAASADTAINN